MTDMFSLPFEYNGTTYNALVATKENGESLEYRITIMNGELEQLLFGHHIFHVKAGKIQPENKSESLPVALLQNALVTALAKMRTAVPQA